MSVTMAKEEIIKVTIKELAKKPTTQEIFPRQLNTLNRLILAQGAPGGDVRHKDQPRAPLLRTLSTPLTLPNQLGSALGSLYKHYELEIHFVVVITYITIRAPLLHTNIAFNFTCAIVSI